MSVNIATMIVLQRFEEFENMKGNRAMFELTETAALKLKEFLGYKENIPPIRIALSEGCSGTSLAMAFDDPKEDDEIFNEAGLTFLIEKDFFEEAKPVKIDFVEMPGRAGFMISSNIPETSSCGGCCSCS